MSSSTYFEQLCLLGGLHELSLKFRYPLCSLLLDLLKPLTQLQHIIMDLTQQMRPLPAPGHSIYLFMGGGLTCMLWSCRSSTWSNIPPLFSASSNRAPTSSTLSMYAWICTCSFSLSVSFRFYSGDWDQINQHHIGRTVITSFKPLMIWMLCGGLQTEEVQ